jgi:hypothetical protein
MSIGACAIPKKKEDKVMKTSLVVILVAALVCIFATIHVVAQTNVPQNQKEKVSQQVMPTKEIKIACPLSMVRAEITTPLPAGWWQTPQEGKLIHTKIQNIGGKRTLCCGYWGYGTTVWIMHEMPAGVSGCRVLPDGFVCR